MLTSLQNYKYQHVNTVSVKYYFRYPSLRFVLAVFSVSYFYSVLTLALRWISSELIEMHVNGFLFHFLMPTLCRLRLFVSVFYLSQWLSPVQKSRRSCFVFLILTRSRPASTPPQEAGSMEHADRSTIPTLIEERAAALVRTCTALIPEMRTLLLRLLTVVKMWEKTHS